MALSSADMDNIRTFLGYSSKFFSVDTVLEQAMNSVATDSDAIATIQSLIASCQSIDTQLVAAQARQRLVSADQGGAVFRGYAELAALRSEGRRYVGRLAAKLGVPVRHDAFAASTTNDAPQLGMFGRTGSGGMKLG